MNDALLELFNDPETSSMVRDRLPHLFQMAELESSRAGKIGMEVGSVRERVITSLLIYRFGGSNVETDLPITEPEVDVKLFGLPISIKTITGREPAGVKLAWTVDPVKARDFLHTWYPRYDLILVHINWSSMGGLYYFPFEAQRSVFDHIGREMYIRLPKPGTNPRGVEISREALRELTGHRETRSIQVNWIKESMNYDPFGKWVNLWSRD